MEKRREIRSKNGQIMIGIICLSFLFGTVGGAIAANYMGGEQAAWLGQELNTFWRDTRAWNFPKHPVFTCLFQIHEI